MSFIIVVFLFFFISFYIYSRKDKKEKKDRYIRIIISTRTVFHHRIEFINILNEKLNYKFSEQIVGNYNYLEIKKYPNDKNIVMIGHKYYPKSTDFVSDYQHIKSWLETMSISINNI